MSEKDEERRDERAITLYHGTSSNRASKIVKNGFKPGIDQTVYFAEDQATASTFAYLVKTPPGNMPPQSFSVVEFTIPERVAKSVGLNVRYIIRGHA